MNRRELGKMIAAALAVACVPVPEGDASFLVDLTQDEGLAAGGNQSKILYELCADIARKNPGWWQNPPGSVITFRDDSVHLKLESLGGGSGRIVIGKKSLAESTTAYDFCGLLEDLWIALHPGSGMSDIPRDVMYDNSSGATE